jgi:hypothetical protein
MAGELKEFGFTLPVLLGCRQEGHQSDCPFCLVVRADRQTPRKDRTLAGLARHRNVATHHACELARERKARSRSWRISTSERDIPPSATAFA